MKRLVFAFVTLGAAGLAGADDTAATSIFASAGPGSLGSFNHLSLDAGLTRRLAGPLSLLVEVQHARLRNDVTATSLSAGLKWRVVPRARLSPFVLASYGVVDYRSPFFGQNDGTAFSLGGGLDWRVSDRASVFIETRANLWTGGGIGDGLDGHVPLRAGVTLGF